MPISLKDPETDRLARELARVTGESLTQAIRRAVEERLRRVTGRRRATALRSEILRIQERIARLPLLDDRSDDEILGYDEAGVPR